MTKTYFLYLDESGDFDSDLRKKYRNECLVGGILYEAGNAMSEEKAKNAFQLTTTDSRHIQVNVPYDYREVEPRRVLDYTTTSKANGNNVDAEYEANNILQIQMQYRLLTQLTDFEFDQVNTAMKK